MKIFLYPALTAVLMAGCSSQSSVSNGETTSVNKINISNAQVNTANASSSNQPNPIPPPAINQSNTNVGNAPDESHTLIEVSSVSRKNLERIKSKGAHGGDKNPPPIPATMATPNAAPDNSELSSTMNAKGVPIETRVFKNNPTLAKIERTFEDVENPVTKVYLKNGKVLTMPKGAVAKPEAASADEILRAVGVKP